LIDSSVNSGHRCYRFVAPVLSSHDGDDYDDPNDGGDRDGDYRKAPHGPG
jgi:hypothetical protein